MRAAEALARAALAARLVDSAPAVAPKACPSISAASIFLIFAGQAPLTVRIKPGTRDGQRIRLAGKGNAGTHGGAGGDLYIIVRAGEHPVFRREADDVHVPVPVTAMEAALGAKIEVPTIDGRAQLKVPPGTQSGQKLRLREKGVPSATKEGLRGDQIVEIKIVVPEARDLKARELWQELAKVSPEDPRKELWAKI